MVVAMKPVSSMELRLRVVALALEPAMVLARAMTLSLDDVEDLARNAYFKEYRARGLSLSQIAVRLRKSPRTAAELARRAQEDGQSLLLTRSEHLVLRRNLLSTLHRGARTRAQLQSTLGRFGREAVDQELADLIEQHVVVEQQKKFALSATMVDLTDAAAERRFASAQHFVHVVGQTLFARFFGEENAGDLSFARVLTFLARPKDLSGLGPAQFETLLRNATTLDAAAQEDTSAREAHALIAVVPTSDDILFRSRQEGP